MFAFHTTEPNLPDMRSKYLERVEIHYETGELRFRYSCYLSPDTVRWVFHGQFTKFYKNGRAAITGKYYDGFEDGEWQEYHEDGSLAAEGSYELGEKKPGWRYCDVDGKAVIPTSPP